MKYRPAAFEINLCREGFVSEVGSLFSALCRLHDQKDARGLRYALVTVLVYVVLAKLAEEDHHAGDGSPPRQWSVRASHCLWNELCPPVFYGNVRTWWAR